ncbi:Chloroperoxidase [Pseudocercospora fuligena]|uniref:Chloroperoxidase n=1 Tax=Pseudocercospora fuligena TaxID=685502 RepID=A0A8H6RFX4_9PEZI|nr:Chloroperoxidase [Pseudocercospora fuligena]
MPFLRDALLVAAAFVHVSHALPSWAFQDFGLEHPNTKRNENLVEKRYDGFPNNLSDRLGKYQAPGPSDSRGPCPGLNTLANHGLINRNGKNIKSDDLKLAFPRGFGIREDGFDQALHNYEVVCEYIKGATCGVPENNGTFILTNLTLLGEPHAFEHDHSYSRQDYKQNYARGGITDNIYFNSSEFQTSLDVVGYKPSNPPKKALANYQQFNEIRLQRESIQNKTDWPGWFQQNIPPTLFETGFIFGATFDRDSKGNMIGSVPMVRLDWWNFWFSEESFPTQLGWVPASTNVFQFDFITSVSSAVLNAKVTSTPNPLPSGALKTTYTLPENLPEQDPSPTVPLFGGTAYVAPTKPANIKSEAAAAKRDMATVEERAVPTFPSSIISAIASEITAAPNIINSALAVAGPAPSKYNFYVQELNVQSLKNQIAQAQSYESKVLSAITSLARL